MTEYRETSNPGRTGPQRRRSEPLESLRLRPELLELRQEARNLGRGRGPEARRTREPRWAGAPRPGAWRPHVRPRHSRRRRLILPAVAAAVAIALAVILHGTSTAGRSFALPSRASLEGMSIGGRIVALAESQLGYSSDPSDSYCNKFSAYWGAGSQNCPGAEASEEWCSDFAAWAWRKAGVRFDYGFLPGEINAGAASFYTWGVLHGTWHAAYRGYQPQAGDVAVYGLRLGDPPSAAHVAIVTGGPPGGRGPDVVNGDGDRTGFSVVEAGTNQLRADTGHGQGAPLAGYVSPD